MSVTLPIRNMHVPFDIPLASSITIDPNRGMNKVRAGFAVPESELNDFDQSSVGRSKSRPEGSRIPKRLPFELGPFCGDLRERFVYLQNTQISCFAVDTKAGRNRTLHFERLNLYHISDKCYYFFLLCNLIPFPCEGKGVQVKVAGAAVPKGEEPARPSGTGSI